MQSIFEISVKFFRS